MSAFLLKRRMVITQESLKERIAHELKVLETNARRAREAIEKGNAIDGHLVTNAAPLTATIAEWNMLMGLVPYLDEPEEK